MSVTPQLDLRDAHAPRVLFGAGPVTRVKVFMITKAKGQCLANPRGACGPVTRLLASSTLRPSHVLPVLFLEGE